MHSMIASECAKSLAVLGGVSLVSCALYQRHLDMTRGSRESQETSSIKDKDKDKDKDSQWSFPKHLTIYSYQPHHEDVLAFVYERERDKINHIAYENSKIASFSDWRNRRKETPGYMRTTTPTECHLFVDHEYQETIFQIEIDISFVKDAHGENVKMMKDAVSGCGTEETFLRKVSLSSVTHAVLQNYVDVAVKHTKHRIETHRRSVDDSMNIYYYRKEYWALFSKSPKRCPETVYLKEGQHERMLRTVREFFSKDTRDVYLTFGIPYKNVCMIYGPPGTGKTSTIRSIASTLDCDLYVLPITKDMLDIHLVDAFTHINDNEDKERVIVIEDIDTLFEERKEGDKHNGITLQGILNCLDGFTCVEGTMLFITANNPEILDHAILRSCRIDHKFELGYADKYQTRQMFTTFFPDQKEDFKEFYEGIEGKNYTTAMLQEFFFYNRDCPKILELLEDLSHIMSQNEPSHFKTETKNEGNFYM